MRTLKIIGLSFLLFIIKIDVWSQKKVTITMDDIPNTRLYSENSFQAKLLQNIEENSIPVTAFINEGLLYKNQFVEKNFSLLNQWVKNENISLGNHTFSHPWYSQTPIDSFMVDVIKGEAITRELAKVYEKELKYFRFPFNDLGKDSIQQVEVRQRLESLGYIITPFTVESSDWMFNFLYEYYLEHEKPAKAKEIGEAYTQITLQAFGYFDSISIEQYGRSIPQIYLCHDNAINTDYLIPIITQLISHGYEIINIEEAMIDEVYQQENSYYKKWGISWIYRWMEDVEERKSIMTAEPDIMEYYRLYEQLSKE